MVYLDNAATTKIHDEVLSKMMPYLTDYYGNAGTIYGIGRKSAEAVADARRKVASFIKANPEQIVFTSGGSESNNTVFAGLRKYLRGIDKRHIIVSSVEHDSVMKAVNAMGGDFKVSFLPVDEEGVVILSALEREINEHTGLVSVMYVNNETGAENPVAEIGDICKKHGILFHTDCVQAAGCHEIDVDAIKCDFLSISSHKIHGPKGVGALYVRNRDYIKPLINGGAYQEHGLRGGTENVAGIVGFGAACELFEKHLKEFSTYTSSLKQHFYSELQANLKDSSVMHINGGSVVRRGKTLNLRFDGIDGETLLLLLDSKGVCVSSGSACKSLESKPSKVLTEMGISPEEARSSIRVSFSVLNTEEEVKTSADIVAECVYVLSETSRRFNEQRQNKTIMYGG